jgi:hypothetical protein
VAGIDKDDLVVLVDTILVNPVRVEDPEVTTAASDALLRNILETTLRLEVVYALAHRLAVGSTYSKIQYLPSFHAYIAS